MTLPWLKIVWIAVGALLLLLSFRKKWIALIVVAAVAAAAFLAVQLCAPMQAVSTTVPTLDAPGLLRVQLQPPVASVSAGAPTPPTSEFGITSTQNALMGWDRMTLMVHGNLVVPFEAATSQLTTQAQELQRRREELAQRIHEGLIEKLQDHLASMAASPDTPAEVRAALQELSRQQREALAARLISRGSPTEQSSVDTERNTGSIASQVKLSGSAIRRALGLPVRRWFPFNTTLAVAGSAGLIVAAYLVLRATTRRTRRGGA